MKTVTFILWVPDQQTQLWFFCGFWSKFIRDKRIWKGAKVKKHRKKYHESLEYFQGPKWLLLCHNNINKWSHNHWPLCNSSAHKDLFEVQGDTNRNSSSTISKKKKDEHVTNTGWAEIMSCNSERSLSLPLAEGYGRGYSAASWARGEVLQWDWNFSKTRHLVGWASGKTVSLACSHRSQGTHPTLFPWRQKNGCEDVKGSPSNCCMHA